MSGNASTTPLRIAVLGLSLSSSWGNGHATTWRALLKAFAARGHEVLFLERDQPWYAAHRDLASPDFCHLTLYDAPEDLRRYDGVIAAADAVIIGSYVPDGIAVADHVFVTARGPVAFYDIDTPVTLAALAEGTCSYLAPRQIARYDTYLSFTGGPTLDLLETRYHAPRARALYCSVDTQAYAPLDRPARWDLGYLGTYSPDRQPVLERLLIAPARAARELRFVVAGPQYPDGIDWPPNVERIEHVGPPEHPAFYARCRFTLNVTRAAMRAAGHSPSVRLFEAAACATPIISDRWAGIETLFTPDAEIILADGPEVVLARLRDGDESARRRMGLAARGRILAAHSAAHRAAELEAHLREAGAGHPPARAAMVAAI